MYMSICLYVYMYMCICIYVHIYIYMYVYVLDSSMTKEFVQRSSSLFTQKQEQS